MTRPRRSATAFAHLDPADDRYPSRPVEVAARTDAELARMSPGEADKRRGDMRRRIGDLEEARRLAADDW